MIKFFLISLMFTFLIGCTSVGVNVNKEFDKTSKILNVEVITAKHQLEFKSILGNTYVNGLMGRSYYYRQGNKCKIIVLEPINVNDFKTLILGHELMHCLYGNYHN